MPTRVVDRYGEPFETVELRRRIGFMGGDLIADSEPCSGVQVPAVQEGPVMVEHRTQDPTIARGE